MLQPGLFLCEQRLTPDKATGLVHFDSKAQPCLERGVLVGNVMAPMAIAFFHAQRIQRMIAGQLEAEAIANGDDAVVDTRHEFGRDVQFPTKLANIGDARGAHDGIAEFDLLAGRERKGLVRQVIRAERLQQRPGIGAHDRDDPHARGDIGQDRMSISVDMALKPIEIARFGFGTCHDQKRRRAQPSHRQIGLDTALLVQPLRINQLARRDIDVIGANPVEHAHRIAALQPELCKARLIEQANRFAHRLAFSRCRIEPVLPAIAIFIFRFGTGRCIPVRSFPAKGFAMAGTGGLQSIVQRRFAYAARRFILLERPVRRVQQPQALADPFAQIFAVDLERHVAANVDRPQVSRRDTVADPFGHDLADATRRLQADRIQSCGDEAPRQLSAFTQMVAHIGCEAFRAAEEFLDAGGFQRRNTAHRVHQHGFEVSEIASDLVEAKVFGNTVHAPRAGIRFESPDQQLAGVIFVIAAIIIVAQHRQIGGQPGNPFEQHIIMFAGV